MFEPIQLTAGSQDLGLGRYVTPKPTKKGWNERQIKMGFEKQSGLPVWAVCAQGNDTKPWGPCILTGSLQAGLEALEDPCCHVRAWVPVQRPSSILSGSYSNPSPVSQPHLPPAN